MNQPRVFFVTTRTPQSTIKSVRMSSSVEICASLGDDDKHEHFAQKHYPQFDLTVENKVKFQQHKEKLQLQTYIDVTDRHASKEAGIERIAWIATLLGAAVATIEFVRVIVLETSGSSDAAPIQIIGYVEGFLGLLALVITQIRNKQIQADGKAAVALDKFYAWVKDEKFKGKDGPTTDTTGKVDDNGSDEILAGGKAADVKTNKTEEAAKSSGEGDSDSGEDDDNKCDGSEVPSTNQDVSGNESSNTEGR